MYAAVNCSAIPPAHQSGTKDSKGEELGEKQENSEVSGQRSLGTHAQFGQQAASDFPF